MSRTIPRAYVTAAWSNNCLEAQVQARRYCKILVDMGYCPICPVLAFNGIFDSDNPDAHKLMREMSEDLLKRSRFLVVCGNHADEEVQDDISIAKKARLIITSLEGITGYH